MKVVFGLVLSLMILVCGADLVAQTTYPDKPVRIIVGFPPGSSADTLARLLGPKYSESWGNQVLVENVAGAAGNMATERVARAAGDGYTLGLLIEPQIVINPSLYRLSFDPGRDIAPISQIALSASLLVVGKAVPATSIKELVNLAKGKPGEISFASGGSGSAPHMAAELLKSMAGIDIQHVPYKGIVLAVPDLLSGRVTMMISPIQSVLPLVRDGKLRALAVTSLTRTSMLPQVPTVAESGYSDFEATLWYGLFAPANTPAAITNRIHAETVKAVSRPEIRSRLSDLGMEAIAGSPGELAAVIRAAVPKWAKLIKESGIKPD